ncbi:XdhC family protein [Actinocatenispora sera]|uniref:XdhC family protein n=1 Tax=Actinocatenispora sera TaxID=390989 RepID=UPI0033D457B4
MTDRGSSAEQRLRATGTAYVRATVVRAQPPTSALPGDSAVVLADGTIDGFVGGQCASGSVRVAALTALRDREPMLLRILPDSSSPFPDVPGAHLVVNPCLSGGAIEVFLEPQLPAPAVRVVGGSPIARAVRQIAPLVGLELADEDGGRAATAVVIATHGGDEAATIRAAVVDGAGYVGLVASQRRGAAVLAETGLTETELTRVHSPAGLAIGARSAPEIALAIVGEIVRELRTGGLDVPAGGPAPVRQAVDPVCGMTVVVGPDTPRLSVGDEEFFFCGPGCRDRYAAKVGA